jgi:hypothetical protein
MVRVAFILFLILFPSSFANALPQAAPFAGIGVLIVRPCLPENDPCNAPLVIYEDPGIKRIAEINYINIPGHFDLSGVSSGEVAITVMGKRGDWLKISFDDAGRRGWIRKDKFWKYIPWSDFLTGRKAVLLGGLQDSCYLLHKEASDLSGGSTTLSPGQDMQILDIDGDWANVIVTGPETGWIRWRGGDGRFMISVPGQFGVGHREEPASP